MMVPVLAELFCGLKEGIGLAFPLGGKDVIPGDATVVHWNVVPLMLEDKVTAEMF